MDDGHFSFVPMRGSDAKRNCKSVFLQRKGDFGDYVQNIVVFEDINELPWVFEGDFRSASCVKIPQKFKNKNKLEDCVKKLNYITLLQGFTKLHKVKQEKRNEIHKSKIRFLGRDIEHKIVSFL